MCVWLGGAVRYECSVRVVVVVSSGGSSCGGDASAVSCARDVVCIACVAVWIVWLVVAAWVSPFVLPECFRQVPCVCVCARWCELYVGVEV